MDPSGSLTRHAVVDPEKFFQNYEAMKEDYDALRKRHSDLSALHSQTVNNLELAQEEVNRTRNLLEDTIRDRNQLRHQCSQTIRQWDSALQELREYKEALGKVQQQHEEAMKEINQAMAVRIKTTKDLKRLADERDDAFREYTLIMSERDSVHRELEKLTEDLGQAKKQTKVLEGQNKELSDKVAEAVQEADISKRRRDWAFTERDKIVRERESLRTLCDRLRRERDRAVSDLAEALSESEDIKKQKNLASKQLKELREKIENEKDHRGIRMVQLSNSSSFSESRDSAIDSDMPSGHYSIKLPNGRGGADHGLVLEPGVYISRIIPGSPAAKDPSLAVGDRVLYINDTLIDNLQDAIQALSEDADPIMLMLSRSIGHIASPLNSAKLGPMTPQLKLLSSQASPDNGSGRNNSTSSLKSDKSDNSAHPKNQASSSIRRQHGTRLKDKIFGKLPKKKNSSPEEKTLEELNAAIASGAGSGGTTQRKVRKKRSGRSSNVTSSDFSSNRNGTWPRVLARNNNSYTLPHDVISIAHPNDVLDSVNHDRSSDRDMGASHGSSLHHNRRDYDMYATYAAPSRQSNTVCVRRNNGKVPITAITWDNITPHAAKSVGAIAPSSSNTISNPRYSDIFSLKSSTHTAASSTILPQQHRYSMGIFDTTTASNYGKISKMLPERNSMGPLTMSDGSSIDFSVKSGPMEFNIDYYKKRLPKTQINSSESDHLDKVVSPPSLPLTAIPTGSYSLGGQITLDKLSRQYATLGSTPNPRYSLHSHDIRGNIQLPLASSASMSGDSSSGIPISVALSGQPSGYSFEPLYQHSHSHGGLYGTVKPTITVANTLGSGARSTMNYFTTSDDMLLHPTHPVETSGTFPRNRDAQRIRIPSNQSVTSRSSTEKFDPHQNASIQIEVLEPREHIRTVSIHSFDKSPLGINIKELRSRNGISGIFVSNVNENSVAAKAGLRVGDQLLEVCGLNMRSATYDLAAKVLQSSQSGDSITMRVQYAPEKYREGEYDDDNSSSERGSNSQSDDERSSEHEDENNSSLSDNESRSSGQSGSPTPCNSRQSTLVRDPKKNVRQGTAGGASGASGGAGAASLTSGSPGQILNQLEAMNISGTASLKKNQLPAGMTVEAQQQLLQQAQQQSLGALVYAHQMNASGDSNQYQSTLRSSMRESNAVEPRLITLTTLSKTSSNLGICLVGGNLVGIYVFSVQRDSIAERSGLRTGDQLLEFNGTDLRRATAEEAANELAKPMDKAKVLVQYNIQRYNEIKDQPGDGFYIRALFDHPSVSGEQPVNPDSHELTFHKDEILYVDNTMYEGKPGRWRAYKVNSDGQRQIHLWGVIPSKHKVEEDLMFKRSLGDLDGDRRSSTITRRSFFRRKSQHRSSSRELASFSDFSINMYGDLPQGAVQLKEDLLGSMSLSSYQRVERLEYMLFLRPVVIIGGLSDLIVERLLHDYPYHFGRTTPEIMHRSGPMLEQGLADSIFVDYKRKGSHYECVTMQAIKEICSKKLHCILDISTAGVERLQRAQMYPIVLMIKFKGYKQIRELKDLRSEKISVKAAKELYENSLKVENEYQHLITRTITGTTNISYIIAQTRAAVETEQSTTLWIPTPTLL